MGVSVMHDKAYPELQEDGRWSFHKPAVIQATTYHAHGRNHVIAFLDNGEIWEMGTGAVEPKWTRLPPIPGTV
jgi:hypothetical protein